MRGALAFLLVALVWLGTNAVLWFRRSAPTTPSSDPARVLEAFERAHASKDVPLGELYAGRLELIEPRLALPTWHRHPYEEATRVNEAIATCPPRLIAPVSDPVLAKAYEWHARTCAGGRFDAAVGVPPLVHPSGRSYAALALAAGGLPPTWVAEHARDFHVAELSSLDARLLSESQRPLARLDLDTWAALTRGDLLAFDHETVIAAEHDALGLSKLRIFRLADWDGFARRGGVALVLRSANGVCQRPATPDLCWKLLSSAESHRTSLLASTTLSFLLALGSVVAIVVWWSRERSRLANDRVEALRILTHELRTPATSLRLDIEPLRAHYDALPAQSQESLLRVSDGVERLHRVIHRSARYLALLEAPAAEPERLLRREEHASIAEVLAALAEEWPEHAAVNLSALSPDGPIVVDTDWLGLVLRNLVENAVRHGRPPVSVTWATTDGELVIRVGDAGATPSFTLREVAPFRRRVQSAGLGLGLSIILRATRLLGGRLVHEPSPTVFELRIPLATEA